MPPQLKRLLPLFAIFIVAFLILRHFLIPESFGEHGHYLFNAVYDNQDKELHYAGGDVCADCHEDQAQSLASDMHKMISCETCHGPGLEHIETESSEFIEKNSGREFCGLCHSINYARKTNVVVQINTDEHNPEKNCIECHNPHMPWEIKD